MAIQFICPSCKNEIVVKYLKIGDKFMCSHCKLRGVIPETGESVTTYGESEKPEEGIIKPIQEPFFIENEKFATVKNLSKVIKIIAWVIFVVFIVAGFIDILLLSFYDGFMNIVAGTFYLIINLGIAELSLVLLAIEENTRKS